MDDFVSSLCSALSFNSLWGIVGSAVPFLAISILFGLGVYLINKILDTLVNPDKPFDELPGVDDDEYDRFYDELELDDRDYDDYDDDYYYDEYDDSDYEFGVDKYSDGWENDWKE